MQEKSLIHYKVDIQKINSTKEEFLKLDLSYAKDILLKSLNINMLYIPQSLANQEEYNLTPKDINLTNNFYKK